MTGGGPLQRFGALSIGSKLKVILMGTLVPLALLCALLLYNFVKYSGEYDRMIESLTVASEFSYDFKNNLDTKMYQFVVRSEPFELHAPLDEVTQARDVIGRLKDSTTEAENLRRLYDIEELLDKLESNVIIIRDGEGYDFKLERLDKRVWVLTELVREKVQDYIYYETISLAQIRNQIKSEIRQTAVSIGVLLAVLFTSLSILALRVSGSIAGPIKELSDNIRSVGEGDFTIRPVSPGSNEVQALSQTFEGMVERIRALMENIRQDQNTLRMAEFRLLQAQINPHFLYNTFDTVIWLAEDRQYEQVIHLITSLSSFFRTMLSNGEDIITVREEALHVQSYLEIQQMRYRDILSYEIDISHSLGGYRIPKLTLQPLVENALYHGLKNKRVLGKIVVRARLEDGMLLFSVWDNGLGMKQDVLEEIRRSLGQGPKKSFGLSNIDQRLQLYYGADCGLSIVSEYGLYTNVTVTIPAEEIPSIS